MALSTSGCTISATNPFEFQVPLETAINSHANDAVTVDLVSQDVSSNSTIKDCPKHKVALDSLTSPLSSQRMGEVHIKREADSDLSYQPGSPETDIGCISDKREAGVSYPLDSPEIVFAECIKNEASQEYFNLQRCSSPTNLRANDLVAKSLIYREDFNSDNLTVARNATSGVSTFRTIKSELSKYQPEKIAT